MDNAWLGQKHRDILPLGYREIYTKYYKLRAFYDTSLKLWRVGRYTYKYKWHTLVNVTGIAQDTNGRIAQKYKTIITKRKKKFIRLKRKRRNHVKKTRYTRSEDVSRS